MAQDWFLRQLKEKASLDEVEQIIRLFFDDIGAVFSRHKSDLLVIDLPGKPSDWYSGLFKGSRAKLQWTRFIEVRVSREGIDLTTRMQDEFTNCLAERLASILARRYGFTVEPPG